MSAAATHRAPLVQAPDAPAGAITRLRWAWPLAIVGRSRNHSDAPLEAIELLDAALTADADDLIAPLQRLLHHVLAELPRRSDDADPQGRHPVTGAGVGETVSGAVAVGGSSPPMSRRNGGYASVINEE